jgi:hypothetical protein
MASRANREPRYSAPGQALYGCHARMKFSHRYGRASNALEQGGAYLVLLRPAEGVRSLKRF